MKLEATEGEQQRGAEMCCADVRHHETQQKPESKDFRERFFIMRDCDREK